MPGAFSWDDHTEAANTPIVEKADPVPGFRSRITSVVYTPGTTAHDLWLLRAIDETTTTAAAAAAASTIVVGKVTFNDQTLASGDYLLIQHSDGTWEINTVSSVASLTITLGANLAKAVNASATVYMFGSIADTAYHVKLTTTASTRTIDLHSYFAGLIESGYDVGTVSSTGPWSRDGYGDPLLFYSGNATAAGTLKWGAGLYVP